jgi:hypothetical protein
VSQQVNYICTRCGEKPGLGTEMEARDLLTVKRVEFRFMGAKGRVRKGVVLDWLCAVCMLTDPDFFRDWTPPKFD